MHCDSRGRIGASVSLAHQFVNYWTFVQRLVYTLRLKSQQCCFELLQFVQAGTNVLNVSEYEFVYVLAGRVWGVRQVGQTTNLILTESQRLAAKDEVQPLLMR